MSIRRSVLSARSDPGAHGDENNEPDDDRAPYDQKDGADDVGDREILEHGPMLTNSRRDVTVQTGGDTAATSKGPGDTVGILQREHQVAGVHPEISTLLGPADEGILNLLARGFTTRQISRRMHLGEAAVQKRVGALLTAFNAHTRPHLAAKWSRLNHGLEL